MHLYYSFIYVNITLVLLVQKELASYQLKPLKRQSHDENKVSEFLLKPGFTKTKPFSVVFIVGNSNYLRKTRLIFSSNKKHCLKKKPQICSLMHFSIKFEDDSVFLH